MGLGVYSEIGTLKSVLIHRPDEGIEAVTPSKALKLLYEDIVYLPTMQAEHDVLTGVLKKFVGDAHVYEFEVLLTQVLEAHAGHILYEIAAWERWSKEVLMKALLMPSDALARFLISGIEDGRSIMDPVPNLIFTRDIGAVVGPCLVSGQAAKKARYRETLLTQWIFKEHPLFVSLTGTANLIAGDRLISSIEGGDVMMFGNDLLLIGCSERSDMSSIQQLMGSLFKRKAVANIAVVSMPKVRYCMHLDTIMTRIAHDACVAFGPLVCTDDVMGVTLYSSSGIRTRRFTSLQKLILSFVPTMNFVLSGGGIHPHDEREQWTDGCNLVCLTDGVALTYDRNVHTANALEKAGFSIVRGQDLLNVSSKDIHGLKNTIITIPSAELSRARGGTHCLTLPLSRG